MNWLIEHAPFILLIAGVAAAALLARRYLGEWGAVAALVAGFLLIVFREGRRDGRQAQVQKDRVNADRAERRADQARVESDLRNSDADELRESDGYRRD
jgi:hypothetical protein